MVNKAVILCAGSGNRLLPLTKAVPKALLPLGNLPVIAHIVEELRSSGITQFFIIMSEETKSIANYYGVTKDITYCNQWTYPPMGTGNSLRYARDWAGSDSFVVAYGDAVMVGEDPTVKVPHLKSMLDFYEHKPSAALMLAQNIPDSEVERCGIIKPGYLYNDYTKDLHMNGYFMVKDLVEKPALSKAPSNIGIAGRFVCNPVIFSYLDKTPVGINNEWHLTDTLQLMCKATTVTALCMAGTSKCQDMGTLEGYFTTNKLFMDNYKYAVS